jgi:hypothetical protein
MGALRAFAAAAVLAAATTGCTWSPGTTTTTLPTPTPASRTGGSIGKDLRKLSPPKQLLLSDVRATACCVEAGFVLIGGYQTGSFDLDTAEPVLEWVESLGTEYRFTCSMRELVDDPTSCAKEFPRYVSANGAITAFGEVPDMPEQAGAELWVTRSKDSTFSVYLALWAEMR